MKRSALRRRDRSNDPATLVAQIESGQPWERPELDGEINLRLYYLLTGHDHFGEMAGPTTKIERAAARKLWESVSEPFVGQHAARHPGSRPWAWWEWEATEPRKLLDGDPDQISPAARSWMGRPSAYGNATWESEAAYLERLGLLQRGEFPARAQDRDPATAYAREVVAGEVTVCKPVIWACQRHLQDLSEGWRRGLYFDRQAADYRLAFSRWVRHYQSGSAHDVFEPEPIQCFWTGSIFGWKRTNGRRRFRVAWREIPRKNGKTFQAAEDALFCLISDGERAAENFVVATKRENAAKCVKDAIGIREESPLIERVTVATDYHARRSPFVIQHKPSKSSLRTLASDARKEHGHNAHLGTIDEVHEGKEDSWMVMKKGMSNRSQPLLNAITTAGADVDAFGGRQHEKFLNLLDPDQPDFANDAWFAVITTLDERDDWKNETLWRAANPLLGVSKQEEALAEAVAEARLDPSKLADTLIYDFNVWVEAADAWLDMEAWKACSQAANAVQWRAEQLERLQGEACIAGFDNATRHDLAALVLWFYDVEPHVVIPWFWIADYALRQRVERDRVPYDVWLDQGFIEATPGKTYDEDYIFARIAGTKDQDGAVVDPGLAGQFDIRMVSFDPWNARGLAQRLDREGLKTIECRQGFATLSEPSKDFEARVGRAALDHGANPVLAWNARNVSVRRDPNGNIMPDKTRENKRIDGIAAAIDALWQVRLAEKEAESAYDDEDLVTWL